MTILGIMLCATMFQGGWEPLSHAAWIEKSVRLASNPVEKNIVRLQDSPQWYSRPDQSVWTGKRWMRVPRLPVAGRQEQVLAYDPVNQGLLLFGGGRNPSLKKALFMGDTWLWKRGKWSLQGPLTSPSPRYYNSYATDLLRKRVVCWDGGDGTFRFGRHFPSEVWEWDGSTWILIKPKKFPKARWMGSMTFDPVSKKILLFGGTGGPFYASVPLKDLWEWDGKTWTEKKPVSQQPWPKARGYGQRFIYHPKLKKCLLVGGAELVHQQRSYFSDTWAWDGKTKRWSLLHANGSIPGFPVLLDSVAVDPLTQNVILVGRPKPQGPGLTSPRETWTHDGQSWSKVFTDPPSPPSLFKVGWDPKGDRYIGLHAIQTVENGFTFTQLATWEFKAGIGWRKLLGPAFKNRSGFSVFNLITHEASGTLLLLESRHSSLPSRTYLWDSRGNRWVEDTRKITAILGGGNRVCYDSKMQAITFFGFDRYLYRWTPAKGWTKDSSLRIPLRVQGDWQWDGKVAYDSQRDRFVICRPWGKNVPWPNWEWDRKTWKSIPGLGGPARFGIRDFSLVHVPELGGILLMGGEYLHQNLIWGHSPCFLWDGKNWNEVTWARYPDFGGSYNLRPRSIFYDKARRQLVSFSTLTGVQSSMRLRVGGLVAKPNFARPGGMIPLGIEEPGNAGQTFVLGLSLSVWPGLPFGDGKGVVRRLSVAADFLLLQSLGWGVVGVLDSKGSAKIPLPIPLQKQLAGFEFFGVALILGPKGVEKGTNEVTLQVLR